jgi:hypothetical protein
MKDVAIVGYCRTGIAKAGRGALNQTHGIPMAAPEAVWGLPSLASEMQSAIGPLSSPRRRRTQFL